MSLAADPPLAGTRDASRSPGHSFVRLLRRLAVAIAVIALVFGSLITFPQYLPWMVGVWIGCGLIAVSRDKPLWPWLAVCVLIVVIKRPGWTVAFGAWAISWLSIAVLDWRLRRQADLAVGSRFRVLWITTLLMFMTLTWGGVRYLASHTSRRPRLDDRPVVCLGDSLTDYGYPDVLRELITVPVRDFGVNGITTDEGIEMLPKILATDPQAIVIELGGHDYNHDHKTRDATRANLNRLIQPCRERDIEVILVEIPRGFISDPYDAVERDLAAEGDLQLIDDSLIRGFVFNSPLLPPGIWRDPADRDSDDGLHPNDRGNQRFANRVRDALVAIYGDAIAR